MRGKKLDSETIIKIQKLRNRGFKFVDISKILNLNINTVRKYANE